MTASRRPRAARRLAIGAALAILITLLWPGSALAHARLIRANPAPDTVLRQSPQVLHLWFSEDLNPSASRIVVWDRYRHPVTRGSSTLVPGHSREMEVSLKPLQPGSYLVLWTSVSADDGHILHGFFLFSVKVRGPGPSLSGLSVGNGQGFPDAAGLTSLLAHWIELLAAVTWAGTAIFSAFILGPLRPGVDEATQEREAGRTRRTIWASLILLASSSTVIVALQAYSLAGNNWGGVLTRSTLTDVFADQYGQLWIGRQAIVLVSLVLSLTVARLAEEDGPRFGEQAIVAGIYLYALAGSGHAAAAAIGVLPGTHSNLFSISIFLDWLHLLGDATWFGGQIYIVLVLIPALFARGLERNGSLFLDVLNRFSPAAFASIAFFVLTGTFSGKVQIGSWYAFFNSIYGRALIVKIALIGLMMLVSAYTVFRLRPSIRSSGIESGEGTARLGRLRGWLGVNPFLGAGVLLATSIMFSYPVPPGLSPPGPSAYTFRAGALTGTLAVKPDRSGLNTITVTLRDSAGRPVQQAHVTVLTTMLDMVMGTGVASLREASPGAFSGTTDLGMGGHWKLQVLVYQPSGLTRANVEVRVAT